MEILVSGGQGSDTNPGTIEHPWKSVAKAATSMRAGDTVFIRAGTYQLSNSIRLRNSGSEGRPITFTAYKDEAVIINGSVETCFSLGGISGITFRNLKMTSKSKRVGASLIYTRILSEICIQTKKTL